MPMPMSDEYALKVIVLLGETEAGDDSILEFLDKRDYVPEVCAEAIPFLRSKNNVLFVLKQTSRDNVLKAALRTMESATDIVEALAELNFTRNARSIAVPFLKIEEKTFEEIKELIKIAGYNENFCREVFPRLTPEQISETKMGEFFIESGHQKSVGKNIAPHLRTQENVLFVSEKTNYDLEVCLKVDTGLLETEDELLDFFENSGREYWVWERKIAPLLNLPQKTDDELLALINKTKSDFKRKPDLWVCKDCVEYMRDPGNVWWVMEKNNFDDSICDFAIPCLGGKKRAFRALYKNRYSSRACAVSMTWASSEEEAMWLIDKSGYQLNVCMAGLTWLGCDNIVFLMEKHKYSSDIVLAANPYLDLTGKSNTEIIELMKKGNSDFLSEKCALSLHLEGRSPAELAALIEGSGFEKHVCIRVGVHLKKMEE